MKAEFDAARAQADAHLKSLKTVMAWQASINRALRLGRMPVDSARILRALDRAGLLGGKLEILGSNESLSGALAFLAHSAAPRSQTPKAV